jgi:hypothetical protein
VRFINKAGVIYSSQLISFKGEKKAFQKGKARFEADTEDNIYKAGIGIVLRLSF